MSKSGLPGTPERRRYMARWRSKNRTALREYNRNYGRTRKRKKNGRSK